MRAILLSAFLSMLCVADGATHPARPYYVAVAFHDVVDRGDRGDDQAVTAASLVSFFEWLRGNGWTAITLDDIERARSGARRLPDRAILITFDDGYRSLYTRVFPLLLAYRMPAVAALVGSWMATTRAETRRVGDDVIPASDLLITWDEAREMARSGLVEFATHGYDLHRSHRANPQGGELPAAASLGYDPRGGYETREAYRQRIRADLDQARAQFQKELGRVPRAVAWPFGRYLAVGEAEALAANYRFTLTLDPEPAFPEELPVIPRLSPGRDSDLPSLVAESGAAQPPAIRLVRLRPEDLKAGDAPAFEKALGAAIERVKRLGVTTVVVDAAVSGPQGLMAAWFPNRELPVRADVLGRIVWQMRTRAGVDVAVRLPVAAARTALGNDAAVLRLFDDLGTGVPADALLLDRVPGLAAIPLAMSSGTFRWEVRQRRNALDLSHLPAADALALRAFLAFERARPPSRLFLLTEPAGRSPSAVADLTLAEAPAAAEPFRHVVRQLAAAGWMEPAYRYCSGIWVQSGGPPSAADLYRDVRFFESHNGVAFGWARYDPVADEPKAALVAPGVSAARRPTRF
jgi:peptidoglycan/xylan/chitin deacetylase (PgdA/CDA1 family)